MAVYRSALGKNVDMAALAAKNERTRAVGNMRVNARGDTIDSSGKVIVPVTEKAHQAYSKTVGNRSAQPIKQPQSQPQTKKPMVKEELTQLEKELEDSLDDDLEVEQIKAKETSKK